MATYRTVLKQVAEGLTPENVEAINFNLGFNAAKRSSLTTGIKLLEEMENQDMISEDDLSQLKSLLESHDLKKLSKIVGKFMEKNQKSSQSVATSEDKTSGSLQTDTSVGSIPLQHTSSPLMQPVMQPVPSPQAAGVWATPGGFHGNQYGDYVTSPYGGPIPQQGYLIPNHQQYIGGNHGANFPPGPSPQNHPPSMQQSQYFFPSKSTVNPDLPPHCSLQGNQAQVSAVPNMAPSHFQQSHQQFSSPSTPHAPSGNQQSVLCHSAGHDSSYSQKLPTTKPYSEGTKSNIPHHSANSNHLEPQSSEENQSYDKNDEMQDAVPDTPVGLLENLQIDDSVGPFVSVEPVAKVPTVNANKGQGLVGNLQSQDMNQKQTESSQIGASDDAAETVQADSRVVQRTHVSTPVQPESASHVVKTTAQPTSAVNYGANLGRTHPQHASAYDRWKQDGRKVESFQRGGYELKIINPTKPAHYETGEGLYVLLQWKSEYKIYIRNNESHRCATEVTYDGNWAGEFELRPGESMTIERPTIEDRKFCFVKPDPASGVRRDNPANGNITATFIPEKRPVYMNDLKRGGVQGGRRERGYLEMDHLAFVEDASFDDDDLVVADAMSFNTEGQSLPAEEHDVQRSIVGGGPSSDWRSGATALVGHSNQQFMVADVFDVDESRKVEIQLKLVGLKD